MTIQQIDFFGKPYTANLKVKLEKKGDKVISAVWWIARRENITFRTSRAGDGIFKCETTERDYYVTQLVGTCDFSVYGYSAAGAREKIRRYMEN